MERKYTTFLRNYIAKPLVGLACLVASCGNEEVPKKYEETKKAENSYSFDEFGKINLPEGIIQGQSNEPLEICAGDFDGDGKLDLALIVYDGDTPTIGDKKVILLQNKMPQNPKAEKEQ